MATRGEITTEIKRLADGFTNVQLTPGNFKLFGEKFENVPLPIFKQAIDLLIDEVEFFPSVAKVGEYVRRVTPAPLPITTKPKNAIGFDEGIEIVRAQLAKMGLEMPALPGPPTSDNVVSMFGRITKKPVEPKPEEENDDKTDNDQPENGQV